MVGLWNAANLFSMNVMDESRLSAMLLAWTDAERAALVALLRARPNRHSWPELAVKVAECGSAMEVWDSFAPTEQALFEDGDGDDRDLVLHTAQEDVTLWRAADFTFLTFMDEHYPAHLRDVHQVPPVLFTRGTLVKDELGVSVVGSRKASPRGLAFAAEVATILAGERITVISGLAAGIDASAHRATLAASGRTVAVIGTGIERYYPSDNAGLQDQIAAEGLVMSQFWPTAAPTTRSFPMRNAVMSAYGRATIVVEAGEASGARIQARTAVEHGRPVILTRSVTQSTNWGQALLGRPGVSVAQSPAHAVEIVHDVLEARRRVDDLLSLADG